MNCIKFNILVFAVKKKLSKMTVLVLFATLIVFYYITGNIAEQNIQKIHTGTCLRGHKCFGRKTTDGISCVP